MRESDIDATWQFLGRPMATKVHDRPSGPVCFAAGVPSTRRVAVTPQAPTRPVESPVETPSRPADRPDPDGGSDADADLDDELERIIREIPDPTPQPGGQ